MKKFVYSISVAIVAALGLASCSSDDYDLGAGRIISPTDLSWTTTENGNTFSFTNTSKEVAGVTYYLTLDGRSSMVFPIGDTQTLKVKKNGYYVVSMYAVSRGDQRSLSWTKEVDWFDESARDPQWLGFTEGNLLAEAEATARTWYADGGWQEMPNTTLDGSLADGYTLTQTANGGGQWQAQVHIEKTGVALSAGKTYDFSLAIISTADSEGDGVTVKPQKDGDDGTFFSEARHPIKRGVNVITLTDQVGFDGDFKLALDFAGVPEGTDLAIRNIYVGEHRAENVSPEGADLWAFDFQDEANLLKTDTEFTTKFWIAHEGWQAFIDGETYDGFEGDPGEFVFTAPEGMGTTQWHGQAHIVFGGVQLSAGKEYDFSLVLLSDKDHPGGVTVKAQKDGDDGTFLTEARHELMAFEPTAVTLSGVAGFDGTFQLCLDFAGAVAGAEVRVLGVYLGEHK